MGATTAADEGAFSPAPTPIQTVHESAVLPKGYKPSGLGETIKANGSAVMGE